jgi:hypothetical protein
MSHKSLLLLTLLATGIIFSSCTAAPPTPAASSAPAAASTPAAPVVPVVSPARQVKTVFVIALENHNWTQPAADTRAPEQIFANPHAPFINSLVDGTSPLSRQVAYASAYHNCLSTPTGHNPHIHPSLLSYLWSEAGTNFGVYNNKAPFDEGGGHQATTDHLASYLNRAGLSWKSYQEDIDTDRDGKVLPRDQWTVPLTNRVGAYSTGVLYNYATKHNPMLYFDDVNGGLGRGSGNPKDPTAVAHFSPIQQLPLDLANNTVARYNWITPNQYDEMHSPLPDGYKGLSGDAASIRKGDDYLAALVLQITASEAYRNNGLIIIWCDETEGENADDYSHTIPEIIISPLAHPNVAGKPYTNAINYTHSSQLRTMQEIFQVGPFLRGAADSPDLSDLFAPGVIPAGVPEPKK